MGAKKKIWFLLWKFTTKTHFQEHNPSVIWDVLYILKRESSHCIYLRTSLRCTVQRRYNPIHNLRISCRREVSFMFWLLYLLHMRQDGSSAGVDMGVKKHLWACSFIHTPHIWQWMCLKQWIQLTYNIHNFTLTIPSTVCSKIFRIQK